ncbi:hypothetical protein MAR_020981 [Mya arenaria]|uniref:Large ribosomal subunit protein mL40 n=1 Tax=Mya arenaria TaxID=6604 RepID=A0ABY7E9I9_MYAAR|nr:hypothetical protein MAR_020239 [Mya arenaria]WAR05612.1 hypothetical protein MAR_020981 [Mya arenaria]
MSVSNSGGHGFHSSTVIGFGVSQVHQGIPTVSKSKKLLLMSQEQLTRRKKKLEKELRRLSRQTIRDLRPIEELETPPQLKKDIMSGRRDRAIDPLTPEQLEQEILLEKEWCRHKMAEHLENCRAFNRLWRTQDRALQMLREDLTQNFWSTV